MSFLYRFHALRALRSRNYRLLFLGQGVSLIGTWMTIVATSWLVYRLSNEQNRSDTAFVLGMVNFAAQLPILLFMSFAGVLVDRTNRQRILVITQFLSMLQSAALASLTFSGHITIPQVIGLNFFQGCVNVFDIPARQAFTVEVVDDHGDLSNAIALNSSMFNGARLVGPAIAGTLIAAFGEGACFLIDAISYFFVLLALLAIKITREPQVRPRRHFFIELKEGLLYAYNFAPIRAVLLLVATLSLSVMPAQVLMPIFADRLSGEAHGAQTLGLLAAASGTGALISAIYLASRKSILGLGRVIVIASTLLGAGLIGFGLSQQLWISILMLILSGAGTIAAMASCNTIIQTIVEEDKRGRVMSLFGLAFIGMAPLGSLLAGTLASHLGEPATLALCGAFCLLTALVFALRLPGLRRLVRPIYHSKGIIPQVAGGPQPGTDIFKSPEN